MLPCPLISQGGDCSYTFLIDQMQDRIDRTGGRCAGMTAENDLRNLLLLPVEITDEDLAVLVNASCQEAKRNLMYEKGLSFPEILEDNRLQVKEHYDGRSDYNSRPPQHSKSPQISFSRILDP